MPTRRRIGDGPNNARVLFHTPIRIPYARASELDFEQRGLGKRRLTGYELPAKPEPGIGHQILGPFRVGDELGSLEVAVTRDERGPQVQHRFMIVERSDIAVVIAYLMTLVDRPACPSLEAGVGRTAIGIPEIVDEPSSRLDRVDLEAASGDGSHGSQEDET